LDNAIQLRPDRAPYLLSGEVLPMIAEYPGEVKEEVWLRSVCTDDGDSLENRRLAKADFQRACEAEGIRIFVASHDFLADVFDDSEEPDYPVE
jgi:hypothetical protein